MLIRAKIKLEGVVQGVGFRPFIHRLSNKWGLNGFISNTSEGVYIEVEGEKKDLIRFYAAIQKELPPLARLTARIMSFARPKGYRDFSIRESKKTSSCLALVSPDIAICADCLKELSCPSDRRFLYPFINCTDCGPRFSIIQELPYDRPSTTMKEFRMCRACRKEYEDINERRYHAQPNACAVCGPEVELIQSYQNTRAPVHKKGKEAIKETIKLLKQGKIVAIKGMGGFHIACDALNRQTLQEFRKLKNRPEKPFAIMVKDTAGAKTICEVSKLEEELLISPEHPIVLLKKKRDSAIFSLLAPDNNYLGVMLAYTPLHHLLFFELLSEGNPLKCLVMTSGNIADEPIEINDSQAAKNLSSICDYFLIHNRDIYNRVDDSIVQVMDNKAVVLRRGRGYSPFPFLMDKKTKEILGTGAELKNTFCLTKNKFAFLSQYIGDLKTYSTFNFYKETIQRLSRLFAIKPEVIAYDFHPEYLSTKYAQELKNKKHSFRLLPIQHHQAHLASVIAEHRIKQDLIGVCFDGIGLGLDGKIWGGEFFVGSLKGFRRVGHLGYVSMPGGDRATQEPYRMGISYLYETFGQDIYQLKTPFIQRHRSHLADIIRAAQNYPILTSSAGRLFDAISALLGICDIITYEAQAAVRLQMYAEKSATKKFYRFSFERSGTEFIIKAEPVIRQIIRDLRNGVNKEAIARKFHNGIADITAEACCILRKKTRINTVAVSGGVFQNRLLLETLLGILRKNKFKVYYNELLPTNDGAISLGQVAIANARKSP